MGQIQKLWSQHVDGGGTDSVESLIEFLTIVDSTVSRDKCGSPLPRNLQIELANIIGGSPNLKGQAKNIYNLLTLGMPKVGINPKPAMPTLPTILQLNALLKSNKHAALLKSLNNCIECFNNYGLEPSSSKQVLDFFTFISEKKYEIGSSSSDRDSLKLNWNAYANKFGKTFMIK